MVSKRQRPIPVAPAPHRRLTLLAFDDAQILDITGPHEVFACADRCMRESYPQCGSVYSTEVVGPRAGPVITMGGLRIIADREIAEFRDDVDTLLIAGGDGVEEARRIPELIQWVGYMAPRVRRLASICNGSLILAETGLLDGRRATTHWTDCEQLAREFPAVSVEPDRIYVRDGNIYSSAGVTAGMDLALALVEEDLGRDIALMVARRLVLFLRRPGGQSQFSRYLAAESSDQPVRAIQHYILDHPAADLSVPALAEHAKMSPRTFARSFVRATGITPAKYVEQVRLEAARVNLERSSTAIDAIARHSGFGHPERMRRAFHRHLGVEPTSYRARFNPTFEDTDANAGTRTSPEIR